MFLITFEGTTFAPLDMFDESIVASHLTRPEQHKVKFVEGAEWDTEADEFAHVYPRENAVLLYLPDCEVIEV